MALVNCIQIEMGATAIEHNVGFSQLIRQDMPSRVGQAPSLIVNQGKL